MINIKCLNKKQFFLQVFWQEKLHQKFSAFSTFFSFINKQIKKSGWKVFLKNLPPHFFFICLYFIGGGGEDENLNIYLA